MPMRVGMGLLDTPPPARRKRCKASVGSWRLVGDTLIPKKRTLLDYCTKLASAPPEDPLITFHFPQSTNTVKVHKSRLTIATGPLCALVNAGFKESTQADITLSDADDAKVFGVISSFLYLKQIDMKQHGSTELALAAHRWNLNDLFEAYFVHARLSGAARNVQGLQSFFPLLRRITVPSRFRLYLAINVALNFAHVMHELGFTPVLRQLGVAVNGDDSLVADPVDAFFASRSVPERRSERLKNKSSERDGGASKRPRPRQTELASNPTAASTGAGAKDDPSEGKRCADDQADGSGSRKRPKSANPLSRRSSKARASSPPERSESFWETLHTQGMLSHIIRYVSRYAKEDYSPLFLDVIMRELEPELKDSEVVSLLSHLDFECVGYSKALKKAPMHNWSPRAFRLLALAQAGMLSKGDNELRLTWTFDKLPSMVEEKSNILLRSDSFLYGDHKFILSAACSDCSSNYLAPLIIRIMLVPKANVPVPKNVVVWARVRAIEGGCGCDAKHLGGKRSFRGIVGRRAHSAANESVMLQAFTEGSGEPFVLLDSMEFRNWLDRHQSSCSLLVQAQLRFKTMDNDYENERKRHDFGLNAQHRALMRGQLRGERGRGRCCCGLMSHHCLDAEHEHDSDENDSDSSRDSEPPYSGSSDEDNGSIDFFAEYPSLSDY